MALLMMRLLLLQTKYKIQINEQKKNEIQVKIGKWNEIEDLIEEIVTDFANDPTIDILEVNKTEKYIVFRFDEKYYVTESGWKKLWNKYEKTIHTYI